MRTIRCLALLLGLFCGAALKPALATEPFPSHPIKFVVGFAAGGGTDVVARIMCDWLTPHLGQPCVVENRTGSGGMIAAGAVINAPPDGYTILFIAPNDVIGNALYKNLPFDFLRDSAPVAGIMQLSNVMVVPPSLGVTSVAQFIALAKARPGEIHYASSGNGTSVHMSAELFKMMTNLNMVHVPYRGAAAAYPDLLAGRVHVMFDNIPSATGFIQAGTLRALAVTTKTRSAALPDIPTVAETVPGYEARVFYGVSAPKGTPPDVIDILNKAFTAAISNPAMQKRIAELGGVPMPMTSTEFGRLLTDESEKWADVVKAAGISVE
jgi:tripartite-type tricarboxylate transporter receptor subunit TctC